MMTGPDPICREPGTKPPNSQTRTDSSGISTESHTTSTVRQNACGFATIERFSPACPETGPWPSTAPDVTGGDGPAGAPAAWFLAVLDAAGSAAPHTGSSLRQCPAHPDGRPSLSVGTGRDGHALLHCFGGCSLDAVLAAIACRRAHLYAPPPVLPTDWAAAFCTDLTFPPHSPRPGRSPQSRGYRLDAIHDYGPDHRVLRYRKGSRSQGGKELVWEIRVGSCWEPGLRGTPTSALPLYREPDVRKAVALAEPVLLVESESSVDALRGWYATTWAGGAAAVQIDRIASVLAGYAHLVVIPDNDPPGMACLARLDRAQLAPHVVIPEIGEDARDLLTRVGPDEFRAIVNGALHR